MSKYKQTFAEALKDVREKKSAFRISYSKQGTHAGFEDADSLPDLQKKAADLRSKGFTIDKMGRNTSPVKEDYEVSMAIGQLKTIQERVGKMMDFLSGKSDDYNMEAWLQSKITSADFPGSTFPIFVFVFLPALLKSTVGNIRIYFE